jgi:hypothetical protein
MRLPFVRQGVLEACSPSWVRVSVAQVIPTLLLRGGAKLAELLPHLREVKRPLVVVEFDKQDMNL